MQSVSSLDITIDQVYAYSDSTTVLAWLSKPSKTWTTFVANRVSEIQAQFRRPRWFHVKSEENPADIGSRGLNPDELVKSKMWWNGPWWLGANFTIPDQSHLLNKTDKEMRNVDTTRSFVGHSMLYSTLGFDEQSGEKFQDLSLTSCFERTVRVSVHIFRFLVGFYARLKGNRVLPSVLARFTEVMPAIPVSKNVLPDVIGLSEDIISNSDEIESVTNNVGGLSQVMTGRRTTTTRSAARLRTVLGQVSPSVRLAVDRPKTSYPVSRRKRTVPPKVYKKIEVELVEPRSIFPSSQEMTFVRSLFIAREQREYFHKNLTICVPARPVVGQVHLCLCTLFSTRTVS